MKFFILFLFSALMLTLPRFFKRDFKLPPIHADIPFHPNWEMPSPTEEILEILNAPFSYYSHGNQFTVFISQNGKYVLKLFRYRVSLFPFLHTLKNCFKSKPKEKFQAKMLKTMNAAYLACNEGREFTQAVYCHLNLTQNRFPFVRIILKQPEESGIWPVGKKTLMPSIINNLPLDRYRFILQKKAEPIRETLLSARKNPEEMRKLIDSFVLLLLKRSQKNICNSDPNLGPNFGYIDGKAVEIDFGNYHKIEPNPERQEVEISNYLRRLENWLALFAPEHREYVRGRPTITFRVLEGKISSSY